MQTQAFDAHYRAAWALLKRVMLTGTKPPDRGSVSTEAEGAVAHFQECLLLEPRSWACLWGMGKAKQAMGNHREALVCFERAAAIEAGNADVWREASIAAGALGEATKAVEYGTAALKLRLTDAGLHATAAVALPLAGKDEKPSAMQVERRSSIRETT